MYINKSYNAEWEHVNSQTPSNEHSGQFFDKAVVFVVSVVFVRWSFDTKRTRCCEQRQMAYMLLLRCASCGFVNARNTLNTVYWRYGRRSP